MGHPGGIECERVTVLALIMFLGQRQTVVTETYLATDIQGHTFKLVLQDIRRMRDRMSL